MKTLLLLSWIFLISVTVHSQYVSIPDSHFREYLVAHYPSCFNEADMMDTTCADILNEDSLGGQYYYNSGLPVINSLQGVQYFKSLKYLNCASNQITDLPALPPLLEKLLCNLNQLQSLPPLPPSLQFIDCSDNPLTHLPDLPASLLLLECWHSQLIDLPALSPLLESLFINDNPITQLPPLPASLKMLSCAFMQLTELPPLPAQLTTLECRGNKIGSLPTLPDGLISLDCSENKLTSLPSLPVSVISLGCSHNRLTDLPQLPPALTSLICQNNQLSELQKLPETIRTLYIYNNNIYCLPNVPEAMDQLGLDSSKIRCLPGSSPNLHVLHAGTNLVFLPLCNATNNVHGCQSFPIIEGSVFYDPNNNGVMDSDELPGSGTLVQLSNGDYTFTNDSGQYQISFDTTGPTTLSVSVPAYFKTEPASRNFNFTRTDTTVIQNFAIQLIATKDSLDITIVSNRTRARPGFDFSYDIIYQNAGTTNLSPTVQFHFDDDLLDYDSSSNPSVSYEGNTLTLNLPSFPFGSRGRFTAYFKVKPTAALGDTLCVNVSISDNAAVGVNDACNVIGGSFDPNDKSATPSLSPQKLIDGKYINYTIRFQNTGTDTAFTVVIADTFSNKLQKNTLEVLGSSHLCKTTVDDGIVYFEFKNILLPDSNVNEPASHGYVNFRVKPQPGLALNSTVENTASIYFDFNDPVRTNTAITIIKDPALPVLLLSFTGTLQGSQVRLNWQTANEMNFRGFEVERSADGLKFSSIGSKWCGGNANGAAYSLIDAQPQNGRNYYRLKMLDKDGTARYSGIVLVMYNKNRLSALIGPNPAKGFFTIQMLNARGGTGNIRITDLIGRMVYVKKLYSFNSSPITIDMHSMPKGMYVITIESNGEQLVRKLALQ